MEQSLDLIIVGQAPAKMPGRTSQRIRDLFGIEEDDLRTKAEWINLIDEYPGKDGKGDAFPIYLAAEKAASLDFTGKRVILLGQSVAKAFGLKTPVVYMTWRELNGGRAAVIPHPSPINILYNDAKLRFKVRHFCRTVLALWGAKSNGE